jgi:antitoxin (DNA-binding transcriptional repressor) of toxin-antitoxin stability system
MRMCTRIAAGAPPVVRRCGIASAQPGHGVIAGYNRAMSRRVIHISEAEAASDFAGVLARVRAGVKVIIEHEDRPVAVIQAAAPVRRTVTECIASAKAHEEETGEAPVLDSDFAADIEDILKERQAWNPPAWE